MWNITIKPSCNNEKESLEWAKKVMLEKNLHLKTDSLTCGNQDSHKSINNDFHYRRWGLVFYITPNKIFFHRKKKLLNREWRTQYVTINGCWLLICWFTCKLKVYDKFTYTPAHSGSSCCLQSSSLPWYLRLKAQLGVSLWESKGQLRLWKYPASRIFCLIKVSLTALHPSISVYS